LEKVLPDEVLYSRKRGFGAPIREWFRGQTGDKLNNRLMNSPLRRRKFFDYSFVARLTDEHRSGKRDWSFHLANSGALNNEGVRASHDYRPDPQALVVVGNSFIQSDAVLIELGNAPTRQKKIAAPKASHQTGDGRMIVIPKTHDARPTPQITQPAIPWTTPLRLTIAA